MAHAGRYNVRNYLGQAAALSLAAVLAVGILVATAVPAVACSCMAPEPMAAYADKAEHVIFTGVVQAPDGRGVPVRVTRWFQGPGRDPIVWLDANGFGADGASCGTPLPTAGTEWIFVAYRGDTQELGVNLCTPHAAASDAAGQAMFTDAVATFGQGVIMDPTLEPAPTTPYAGPTAGPAAGPAATPVASPATSPTASGGLSLPIPLLGAAVVGVLALAAGLALLVGRSRRDPA
jgi:hypothetical protein